MVVRGVAACGGGKLGSAVPPDALPPNTRKDGVGGVLCIAVDAEGMAATHETSPRRGGLRSSPGEEADNGVRPGVG